MMYSSPCLLDMANQLSMLSFQEHLTSLEVRTYTTYYACTIDVLLEYVSMVVLYITHSQFLFSAIEGKSDTSLVVCVCPLTSIMLDQKAKLSAKGIATEFVGEAQLDEAANQAVVGGKVQLVFISPENLLHNPRFRGMLTSRVYKEHLCAFVVDEAHCVKSW